MARVSTLFLLSSTLSLMALPVLAVTPEEVLEAYADIAQATYGDS